jgi:hypothetical protein
MKNINIDLSQRSIVQYILHVQSAKKHSIVCCVMDSSSAIITYGRLFRMRQTPLFEKIR